MNRREPTKTRTKNHATVLVVVEGGRFDQVGPDTMPFLHGLGEQGITARLQATPGHDSFSAMLTGTPPDTAGRFAPYVYDPEASPFAWTRRLGPFSRITRPRKWWAPVRGFVGRSTRWLLKDAAADPAWIPPRFLPFFRAAPMDPPGLAGSGSAVSLLDRCREEGFRTRVDSGGRSDVHALTDLVRSLRETAPYDLFVLRLQQGARLGRVHGPFSDEVRVVHLRNIDEHLASVHAALTTSYDSWDLFVCGDRGVMQVETSLDVQQAMRRTSLRAGEDYVPFVHETMLSLWYRSKVAQAALEDRLGGLEGLRMLHEEERRRLRIPTDRAWGDRLFVAEPGVALRPDYLHGSRPLRGVQEIVPGPGGLGLCVLASSRDDVGTEDLGGRSLLEVCPTLCALLGLKAPMGQQGQGFVQTRREPPLEHHPKTIARKAMARPVRDV